LHSDYLPFILLAYELKANGLGLEVSHVDNTLLLTGKPEIVDFQKSQVDLHVVDVLDDFTVGEIILSISELKLQVRERYSQLTSKVSNIDQSSVPFVADWRR